MERERERERGDEKPNRTLICRGERGGPTSSMPPRELAIVWEERETHACACGEEPEPAATATTLPKPLPSSCGVRGRSVRMHMGRRSCGYHPFLSLCLFYNIFCL